MQEKQGHSPPTREHLERVISDNVDIAETVVGLKPFPRKLIVAGCLASLAFFISLLTWSALAPIEGAVVSPGIVSVSSHRRLIQHLEGGIAEKIFVQDGARVKPGQPLVQLRSIQQTSELRNLERQHLEAQAVLARLLAEINSQDEIDFPEEITMRSDEESVNSIVAGQINVLSSLRALNADKLSVLQNRIEQTEEDINGIGEQLKAKQRQHGFIEKELARTREAINRKLLPQTKEFSLQERLAEVEGEIGGYRSKKSQLEQREHELRLQISEERALYLAEVTEQLRKQRSLIFDLSQKIASAADIAHRTLIESPIDGIVVNMQLHTQHGVVAPGATILEIVPTDDEFVVHAFVNPNDIDEVRTGMPADVRLTSLNRRERIPMRGMVTDISADRISNSDSGQDYYLARIDLAKDIYATVKNDLIPGMGADVFILTGSRTPLDYFLSPIMQSLQLGMREQ